MGIHAAAKPGVSTVFASLIIPLRILQAILFSCKRFLLMSIMAHGNSFFLNL